MTGSRGSSFYVGPDDNPDKYRLLQQVGGGGEAQLWQAELSVAGGAEPVAVKVLRPEWVKDFARLSQRWDEQAELLLFLRHPGVVGVRAHFEGAPFHLAGAATETPGRWLYLVMNWVEGQPLRDWVMNNRNAPDRDIRIFRHLEQAAEVLDWLHSGQATPSNRPVVHGDLSPGNVMITPAGQAVLVDFGLIQLVTQQPQEAAGTPGYAAPEVWLSGQYSPASDRYSFGAIAYFALTGTVPPAGPEGIWAGLAATSLLASAPPGRLDQLMEMFSADPAARPRAIEWVRLLRNTVTTTQHRPSSAGMQPVPEQPTVPPRPRRRTGRLAAAVVAVLVVGVVLGAVATGNLVGERATPSGAQSSRAETAPAGPVTTTTTRTTPVTSSAPVTTSGAPRTVATIAPAAATVRRQSGERPLRLTVGYEADLDSLAPDWEVARNVDGADLYLHYDTSLSLRSVNGVDFAPVSGPPDYTTCQNATAYYPGINLNEDRGGFSFCARTSDRRFAFVTIVDPKVPVALDITIWDPPRR